MNRYEVENHAPSFLPQDKNWKLVWSDEFDGSELDRSKWDFRTTFWGKKSPTFTTEGVTFDGESHMRINLIEKNGNFYSAHLQTGSLTYDIPKDSNGFWPFGKYRKPLFMHKYGYYEIRCKLPKNKGWHAAFWLQSPSIGAHPDASQCGVEVDIMENYHQHDNGTNTGTLGCGCGWNGYGNDSKWFGHFWFPYKETEDGWHYYGVDWSKDGYIFYADGKEVGRQMAPECAVSDVEQFILVSTECHGYHRNFNGDSNIDGASLAGDIDVWKGEPVEELKKAVLPDYFEVDFVRVFDQI